MVVAVLFTALQGCTDRNRGVSRTALDEYVAAPDPSYRYEVARKTAGEGYVSYLVELTSQSWLSSNEVDRTLWKHWLVIVRPSEVRSSKALLFISGGLNGEPAPKQVDERMVKTALATNSVVAELMMVPNQPLKFAGETRELSGEALMAYSWDKFLRTDDSRWPLILPMTKAAVRAMDTITAICRLPQSEPLNIDSFVVAGNSKRGWTAWTTAAVDKRVVALVPLVSDMLNVKPSFVHQREAYGFLSPALAEYEALGIMDWQGTPEYRKLLTIVEPFEYRKRLTMPKYVINATGDQFFLPDSSQFYFRELRKPKWLRYVPNTEHSLSGSDAWNALVAFYDAILEGRPIPDYTWDMEDDGSIRVKTRDDPIHVRLWQASNLNARDFRVNSIGRAWKSSEITKGVDGVYVGRVAVPEQGWTAFMVELVFEHRPFPFKFTTSVRVLPEVLPFKYTPGSPPE